MDHIFQAVVVEVANGEAVAQQEAHFTIEHDARSALYCMMDQIAMILMKAGIHKDFQYDKETCTYYLTKSEDSVVYAFVKAVPIHSSYGEWRTYDRAGKEEFVRTILGLDTKLSSTTTRLMQAYNHDPRDLDFTQPCPGLTPVQA